jgi:hypothetical protein
MRESSRPAAPVCAVAEKLSLRALKNAAKRRRARTRIADPKAAVFFADKYGSNCLASADLLT